MLRDMCDKLAFELRADGRLCSCVTVKIRYADFNTFSRQRKIAYTSNSRTLCNYALELFDQLYERRQLIRLIGIRFSGLVRGNLQIRLFEDTEEELHLMEAMDRIRLRFGKDAITWAG
jgi:DNA polymerase-4